MRLQTAPERVDLLLPWLNGAWDTVRYALFKQPSGHERPSPVSDRTADDTHEGFYAEVFTDWARVRKALNAFVTSFDGSPSAGFVEVIADPSHDFMQNAEDPSDEQLDELGTLLRLLLAQGVERDETLASTGIPTSGLVFGVRSAGRVAPGSRDTHDGRRVTAGGRQAREQYRAPGGYVLQVRGPVTSVVPYLMAHLLTAADMVKVKVCATEGCPKLLVRTTGPRGGKPREHCTDCRPPEKNEAGNERKKRMRKRSKKETRR